MQLLQWREKADNKIEGETVSVLGSRAADFDPAPFCLFPLRIRLPPQVSAAVMPGKLSSKSLLPLAAGEPILAWSVPLERGDASPLSGT